MGERKSRLMSTASVPGTDKIFAWKGSGCSDINQAVACSTIPYIYCTEVVGGGGALRSAKW